MLKLDKNIKFAIKDKIIYSINNKFSFTTMKENNIFS